MKHHRLVGLMLWALACGAWANVLAIEQARESDLDGLAGLGPATTQKVLQARAQRPFADWRDFMRRVPGIGPHKAAQLSQQGLRIQGQPYPQR